MTLSYSILLLSVLLLLSVELSLGKILNRWLRPKEVVLPCMVEAPYYCVNV